MPDRPSTVLYTHGGGRLGNQLLRFAHWLAWACENEGSVRVVNLAFWPYAAAFERWQSNPDCVFPGPPGVWRWLARLRRHLPGRLIRHGEWRAQRVADRLGSALPGVVRKSNFDNGGEAFDLDDPGFATGVCSRRLTVCSGWYFSGWSLLEKHEARVRGLLAPARPAVARVGARLRACRGEGELLVGVLLRGTDYRTWREGRYFFPREQYAEWMRQLMDLRAPQSVRFVVTSDEPLEAGAFAGIPWVRSAGAGDPANGWLDSFLELAGCDLILSPPSTFSAGAAWLGGKSLWPLRSAGQRLEAAQVFAHPLFSARYDASFREVVM